MKSVIIINWIQKKMRELSEQLKQEDGLATVEYAIVLVAAAGFAGLLVALLKSDWAKQMLESIIGDAFNMAGQ